ncbi:MAG: hypothetical protein MJZ82_02620 [Paludibacteraceae bacterium]|nr:hypothetical protein [Paludibacteraceae bacterium]
MYNDVNWSTKRVEATISIYSTLLAQRKPSSYSMDRAIRLATELINKLKDQQSADDAKSKDEIDILLGRKNPNQATQ